MRRLALLLLLLLALPARAEVPPALAGTTWIWVGLDAPGEGFAVAQPEHYTLAFLPEGHIALRADCNRGRAAIAFPEPGVMSIGALALTRALCPPGSLSDRFAREVGRAGRWSLRDGALELEIAEGPTRLRFARAP